MSAALIDSADAACQLEPMIEGCLDVRPSHLIYSPVQYSQCVFLLFLTYLWILLNLEEILHSAISKHLQCFYKNCLRTYGRNGKEKVYIRLP